MSWQGIHEHDQVVEAFRKCIGQGRLANAYLFVGPSGVGKRTFAYQLARSMLCESNPETALEACDTCDSCQQVIAGSHPDVISVHKEDDENFIPIEAFIGDREHRNQKGLCRDIGLKPFSGKRKFAIIDDADHLNVEGANSLLKTLEEPPLGSVLILITTSEHLQLPTIRSRCQIVRFAALSEGVVSELLQGAVDDAGIDTADIAKSAGGSLRQAEELTDETLSEFRTGLLKRLSAEQMDSIELGRNAIEFAEDVGTDTFLRRARVRVMLNIAIDFFRQLVRKCSDVEIRGDKQMQAALAVNGQWTASAAADCIDACLDAREFIDRNANLTALLLWWAEEMTKRRPL